MQWALPDVSNNRCRTMNEQTTNRRIANSIWVAVIANTMSFFGFVYEAIDFIPNYFGTASIEAQMHWRSFHSLTNPAYYHIFPSIITICCIVMVWIHRHYLSSDQLRLLKIASVATILVNISTGIAVTQLNDKLYFGTQFNNAETVRNLALIWGILNLIRLSFAAICSVSLLKTFSIHLITNNKKRTESSIL